MDPIDPIAPRPAGITPDGFVPVERLERIARERDRRHKDAQERKRRQQSAASSSVTPPRDPGEDGDQPRIDVRA